MILLAHACRLFRNVRALLLTLDAIVIVLSDVCAAADPAPNPPSTTPASERAELHRNVKTILDTHCLRCHGPDQQRGRLRLDEQSLILQGGDSGSSVSIATPNESLLLDRVTNSDESLRMPPDQPPLGRDEVETLKRWIEDSANWADIQAQAANQLSTETWWSLQPLSSPTVPVVSATRDGKPNPIDGFIAAKLAEKQLVTSPPADRHTLVRRLYFDIIGLPPTPNQVDEFVNSTSSTAYESLVDHLLASPHYGERWGRHWLDIVHFGETHGYDKDQPRPHAWPYRDYVIRSLNADKPYRQFISEQIAGDVLFPGTVDGIEALGFLAAGPWDLIGHAEVPETKIDGKIARHLDRDDFVANTIGTFVGLTVHCAQCHNHKFDPISQEDYYRLQSVFAAIDRADMAYDTDPATTAERLALQQQQRHTRARISELEMLARKHSGGALTAIEAQLPKVSGERGFSHPPEFGYHSAISESPTTRKWVQVDLGRSVLIDHVVLKPCHDDFNNIGAGFGFPVRFKIEASRDAAFQSNVTVVADETMTDFANPQLAPYVAGTNATEARFLRLTATTLAPRLNDYILAVAELEAYDGAGTNVALHATVSAFDSIEAPVRWQMSNLTDGLAPHGAVAPEAADNLARQRSLLQESALGAAAYGELVSLRQSQIATDARLAQLALSRRTVYAGAVHTGSGTFTGTGASGGQPRPIHILPRGDVTKPGKLVQPGALSRIPGAPWQFDLPHDHAEGARRAALAQWISHTDNPLTWRVMANRVWQYHFGRALVDTPNDFGKMGQLPTHPELLDYLATELREHQSLKTLHKLIVTSQTYRQSSATNVAYAELDADNRFLWRQNRRKLEAEAVRDSILFVAGQLDTAMGGPSFQDFVIEHPEHSPHYQYHLFDPADSHAYRRAIYRFTVRSKQQPFMAALDCADPSLAVEKRNEAVTPQQALALLNNSFVLTMSDRFAQRVETTSDTVDGQMAGAIKLALGRNAAPRELEELSAYANEFGLANACRVVLNLNEFLFVD